MIYIFFCCPPSGSNTNKANGWSKSVCGVRVCASGTHQLLGDPATPLCVLIHTLCGKHDGKLPHYTHCDL